MYDDNPVGSWRDKGPHPPPRPPQTVGANATPAAPTPTRPSTTPPPTRAPPPRPPGGAPPAPPRHRRVARRRENPRARSSTQLYAPADAAVRFSPAPQIDRPLVDDGVTVDEVHAFMKGHGGVDVGGQHP